MDAFKFHLQKKQLLDLLVRPSRCRKALEKVILAKFPRPPPPPPRSVNEKGPKGALVI